MFSLVLTQLSVRAGGPEAVSVLVNFNRFKRQKKYAARVSRKEPQDRAVKSAEGDC